MTVFCLLLLYVIGFLVFILCQLKYLDLYIFVVPMCIVKKLIFIVHSKKSNNHENKNETMKFK